MSTVIEVNLNTRARVILTTTGADILNRRERKFMPSKYRRHFDAGDLYETQLWTLMQAFGDEIHMGMAEVPFLDNVMEILS